MTLPPTQAVTPTPTPAPSWQVCGLTLLPSPNVTRTGDYGIGMLYIFSGPASLNYTIVVTGLSGAVTQAVWQNSTDSVRFTDLGALCAPCAGNTIRGATNNTLAASKLPWLYVTLRTAAYPGALGEVTGRIMCGSSSGGGSARKTSVVLTGGSGVSSGVADMSVVSNTLTYSIVVTGISGSATAVRLQKQGPGGDIIYTLCSADTTACSGFYFSGSANLTDDALSLLASGGIYINVMTAANPSGELGGQVPSPPDMTPSAGVDRMAINISSIVTSPEIRSDVCAFLLVRLSSSIQPSTSGSQANTSIMVTSDSDHPDHRNEVFGGSIGGTVAFLASLALGLFIYLRYSNKKNIKPEAQFIVVNSVSESAGSKASAKEVENKISRVIEDNVGLNIPGGERGPEFYQIPESIGDNHATLMSEVAFIHLPARPDHNAQEEASIAVLSIDAVTSIHAATEAA